LTSEAGRRSAQTAEERRDSLLFALLAGQMRAVECVVGASAALMEAANRLAAALRDGGRLVYMGAGSSGLLAMQDGLELPGTFGIADDRIVFVTPESGSFRIDSSGEDDQRAAEAALDALSLRSRDLVIAVSASGATPFTLGGARRAKEKAASLIAIVCRTHAPLAVLADVPVVFGIGAEAVEGSTRLAAGTAQKAALSVISTLAAAELGYVHDGLMINVRPENAKLEARAKTIVARLAGVDEEAATKALGAARDRVPAAIAIAAGGLDAEAAAVLLSECGGDIGLVLARLRARAKVKSAGMKPV